ncbi:MAG: PA14 domain-containing protein, partial [Chloroflexota bacterium]
NLTQSEIERPVGQTGLRPRRTLNRLALALVGLAIGALGQTFLNGGSLWDGLLFLGVAALLFVRALAKRLDDPLPPVAGPFTPPLPGIQAGWRRNMGVWLSLLAVGLSPLAFNFFAHEDARRQAWWLYLACLGLYVAGGVLFTQGRPWRSELNRIFPNRPITLGLAVVLGLALFMRLYHFGSQPFGIWYDEAEAGLQARQMLQQPDYQPIFYPPINVTGHFLTLYALALRWLGDSIYSLRLVSVLFGLGGVLAAYLFGREWRGPRFGLALAFLVAIMRWHVNFSRIAMTGVDAVFFEFLSLYFLLRLLRSGRLREALAAGLTIGFGLMFYTAFRLFLAALVILALGAGLRHWRELVGAGRGRDWPAHLGRLAMLAVAGWLVVLPVVRFAQDEPDAFWFRTNQISVFNKRDQPNLTQALWASTRQHLLMFNYLGDKNGRHNLPGEPMLDPAMGVLAVFGLGLALTRVRDPANALFLLLLPIALLGGILTVDFEAPQSLRSIAVIPAVIYFIALALAALGREAETALAPLPGHWLIGPAAILTGYMLFFNAQTYFNRQANDFASWNAFSAPETITAREMAQLGPAYRYYLSPFLANHPTIRLIAPQITGQQSLNLPDALPIRQPPDRPVGLFIHPDDVWVFEQAQQLYPNAGFEIARGPVPEAGDDGPPVVYLVNLQPADLAAVQGVEQSYYPGDRLDQPGAAAIPLSSGRAMTIQAAWPGDSPIDADFVAEWRGILYAPQYGPYSFRLVSPAASRLEIDGNLILDGQGEQVIGLPLAEGNHTLRLQAGAAAGEVALYWQPPGQSEALIPQWALYVPPVTNHGLLGTYYANERWEGQPALQRIDPFLDTYFHFTPLRRPYTVEWVGALDAPQSGLYRLGLRAVAQAQLFLDGQLWVSTAAPDQLTETALTLSAGLHDLRVRFKDNVDRSRIHLLWATPTGQLEPIPRQNLWPPLGRYPEKPQPPPPVQTASLDLMWVTSLGSPGAQPGQFFEPRDVAVLANGSLVVADTVNRRVQIFPMGPEPLFTPQPTPALVLTGDDLPFEEPLAVGVNRRDEILVLDSTRQWVYRYTAGGQLLDRFGGPTAYLFHPRGLTVFDDDTVALADTGKSRLAFFSADGAAAGSLGGLGSGPGQFNEPTDVLRDAQGTYFVAEAMNQRLQRVDAGGNPLGQWAIPPAYAFDGPHLAFGPDGSIFMTESQSRSLLRYAPDGTQLDQWQSIDPVNLAAPLGVYFDDLTHRLYVTDIWTHQVHIFEVRTAGNSEEW